MFGTQGSQPNRQCLPVQSLSVRQAAFYNQNGGKVFHGVGGDRVLGAQHALLRGQNFAIQLLGFRETALRLNCQCQITHRFQRFRVIRPPDTSFDIE